MKILTVNFICAVTLVLLLQLIVAVLNNTTFNFIAYFMFVLGFWLGEWLGGKGET